MVRRKNPIILITVLVLALSVVFMMNMRNHPDDPTAAPAAQGAPTGESRPKEDPANLISSMHPGKPIVKRPGTMAPPVDSTGDGLTSDAPKPYKPKPTETMTNSGWYKPQSGH